jgi:NADPH-dependent glutamate synthase beta subunit-like oxidoreductase
VRLGAKSVRVAYRRREEDMTALREEVHGALEEGVEMVTLKVPRRIEKDEKGRVKALIVKPQIIGDYEDGRPTPKESVRPEERIPCDIVIIAIGQAIESEYFYGCGLQIEYDMLQAEMSCAVPGMPGVFAGGDCTFGPATVIRAIEAGKVSAANIDKYLGFPHQITLNIEIPPPPHSHKSECGRAVSTERGALDRKNDFDTYEIPMTDEELVQECSRCLRCDEFGMGTLRDGRVYEW